MEYSKGGLVFPEKDNELWFKLSDIPNANYISLFAYNLFNPIRDYPSAGAGDFIKEGFVEWNNGIASYYLKRAQFNQCADFLAQQILGMTDEHKARVKKYLFLAAELFRETKRFRELDFEKMGDKQLIEEFERMAELQKQNHLMGGILTFLPDEEQQRVSNGILGAIQELAGRNAPELNVVDTWNLLTAPTNKSFREKEEIGLLGIAILAQQDKRFTKNILRGYGKPLEKIVKENSPGVFKMLSRHCAKYCWLPYMYSGPANDLGHYCKELKKLIAKGKTVLERRLYGLKEKHFLAEQKQNEVLAKLKPNRKQRELLLFAKELVWIKGYRKDSFYHLFYSYEPFLSEVGRRLGLSLEGVRFFFPWELRQALLEKKYSEQEQRQRKKRSLYYMDEKRMLFYFANVIRHRPQR